MSNHANNNIRMITETVALGESSATLYTSFGYDWANRMQYSQVRAFNGAQQDWELTRRDHDYDAAGRLVQSTYKQWWETGEEPSGDSVEHCYAGSKHIQNHDGDSSYGAVWHWAGANHPAATILKSPNADTASQDAYNVTDYKTPQRRTWQSPSTEGDQRNLYGQGKPMPKDSSGSGADWGTGIESVTVDATVLTVNSRLAFDGTVAPTDLSRATDARDNQRIGIFGSALSYAGASGRVTSEPLGRDLNPNGRGDGYGYMAGALNVGKIAPRLPLNRAERGSGFSINNSDQIDPTPDGDGGGGKQDRPDCCECVNGACPCPERLAGPPAGPGYRERCCCPVECSNDELVCVGDGKTDCSGNICDLPDEENPCSSSGNHGGPGGGMRPLPMPGGGGGCPGCGGGGGMPTDPGFGPLPGNGAGGGYGGGGLTPGFPGFVIGSTLGGPTPPGDPNPGLTRCRIRCNKEWQKHKDGALLILCLDRCDNAYLPPGTPLPPHVPGETYVNCNDIAGWIAGELTSPPTSAEDLILLLSKIVENCTCEELCSSLHGVGTQDASHCFHLCCCDLQDGLYDSEDRGAINNDHIVCLCNQIGDNTGIPLDCSAIDTGPD